MTNVFFRGPVNVCSNWLCFPSRKGRNLLCIGRTPALSNSPTEPGLPQNSTCLDWCPNQNKAPQGLPLKKYNSRRDVYDDHLLSLQS